jgi:hypothetical protein
VDRSRRLELPAHLQAFLYSCIDSIEQLDILWLLRTTGAPLPARAVADQLSVPHTRTRAHLESLVARGLAQATVREEVMYGYRPASTVLAGYCEDLARHLEQSREDVLRFVATLPPPSIRSFANAFKLKDQE